ncbi:MAG TPA: hypothetical protein VIY51_24750 [Xanthobacteraceae bacterium]
MHFDDAYEVLIKYLAALPESKGKDARSKQSQGHGGDLWIPHVVQGYWQSRRDASEELDDHHFQPFYDAAWELCRIGVLRPGEFAPRGWATDAGLFSGDTFSITKFGRAWLKDASQRPVADPSRLAQALQGFADRLGGGFAQRATEAVKTYRSGNYLAACVMAGAAAESILLALAIAKTGDEAKVLVEYNTTGGPRRVTKRVTSNVSAQLGNQLETALQALGHWHDAANHGTMTAVSEVEAHIGLTDLLRLAQFVHDHWAELIA